MVVVRVGDEDPDLEVPDLQGIDPPVVERRRGRSDFGLLSVPGFLVVEDEQVVGRPDGKTAMPEVPDEGLTLARGGILPRRRGGPRRG